MTSSSSIFYKIISLVFILKLSWCQSHLDCTDEYCKSVAGALGAKNVKQFEIYEKIKLYNEFNNYRNRTETYFVKKVAMWSKELELLAVKCMKQDSSSEACHTESAIHGASVIRDEFIADDVVPKNVTHLIDLFIEQTFDDVDSSANYLNPETDRFGCAFLWHDGDDVEPQMYKILCLINNGGRSYDIEELRRFQDSGRYSHIKMEPIQQICHTIWSFEPNEVFRRLCGKTGWPGEKGDKGDPGDDGELGLVGQKGDTGTMGAQGLKGYKGYQGNKGETGERGDYGDEGDRGDNGETGEIGPKGGIGESGEIGDTGYDGQKGEKGEIGPILKIPVTNQQDEFIFWVTSVIMALVLSITTTVNCLL